MIDLTGAKGLAFFSLNVYDEGTFQNVDKDIPSAVMLPADPAGGFPGRCFTPRSSD